MSNRTKIAVPLLALLATAGSAMAQTSIGGGDDPTITVGMPFELGPVVSQVMALAVAVLIIIAGPKISLAFGKRALSMAQNIFR